MSFLGRLGLVGVSKHEANHGDVIVTLHQPSQPEPTVEPGLPTSPVVYDSETGEQVTGYVDDMIVFGCMFKDTSIIVAEGYLLEAEVGSRCIELFRVKIVNDDITMDLLISIDTSLPVKILPSPELSIDDDFYTMPAGIYELDKETVGTEYTILS